MKSKPISVGIVLVIAAGVAVLGVVRLSSSGADVQQQTPLPHPTGSIFGEHTYELDPEWEFARPPEGSRAPEISRDEMIATITSNIEASGEQGKGSVLASVDLVRVTGSALAEQPPGLFWLVVVENAAVEPMALGGPIPKTDEPCDELVERHKPWCLPEGYRMIGTSVSLLDADTGEMFAWEFYPNE